MSPKHIADLYDARAGLFNPEEHADDVRNAVAIVQSLCPELDSRILDLGCGEGLHLMAMVAAGYRDLHGVDISRRAIGIARRNCANMSVSLRCADIAELDWAGFDLVAAFNSSLGSLGAEGDASYISGVARVLRPGGLLLLCYLDAEAALRRVGTFSSLSARDRGDCVTTSVSVSQDGRWMILDQHYLSQPLPSERIRIFGKAELSTITRDAGLHAVETDYDYSRLLPYVGVFLARRA